jgi:Spy/CpxP family protein refolding chaperone
MRQSYDEIIRESRSKAEKNRARYEKLVASNFVKGESRRPERKSHFTEADKAQLRADLNRKVDGEFEVSVKELEELRDMYTPCILDAHDSRAEAYRAELAERRQLVEEIISERV